MPDEPTRISRDDLAAAMRDEPPARLICPCGQALYLDPRESERRCPRCKTTNRRAREVFVAPPACDECEDSGFVPYMIALSRGDDHICYILAMQCRCATAGGELVRDENGMYREADKPKWEVFDEKKDNLPSFCPEEFHDESRRLQREHGALALRSRKMRNENEGMETT